MPGVRRWMAPHNLSPRFAAVSFHGVDSPTAGRRMGNCRKTLLHDHPEGCLIMVFFNTGDNLDAT